MRAFAAERGLSIEELAARNRAKPEEGYDAKCDKAMEMYGRQNHTVLKGRLPHVFVPHAFHVRLVCPLEIRARRRLADEEWDSLAEVVDRIRKRDADDNERYQVLYSGCLWEDADFDLIVDTNILFPKQVAETIIAAHTAWQKKQQNIRSWVSI